MNNPIVKIDIAQQNHAVFLQKNIVNAMSFIQVTLQFTAKSVKVIHRNPSMTNHIRVCFI